MVNVPTLKSEILREIKVTYHNINLAKGYIVTHTQSGNVRTDELEVEFLRSQAVNRPDILNVFEGSDIEGQKSNVVKYLSLHGAYIEAVLSLIQSGILLDTVDRRPLTCQIKVSDINPITGGGSSYDWDFDRLFVIPIPSILFRSFSSRHTNDYPFTDPDLFILQTRIDNAHSDVIAALRDSIDCFKNNLYRASLTMLGKAVEGAWIELGFSLANIVAAADPKFDKDRFDTALKGFDGVPKKIESVVRLFTDRQDLFKELSKNSQVTLYMLREAQIWSDVIRDSRNAIHFGVEPRIPNTYEKTSTLLYSAITHLGSIYTLKKFADIRP